MNSECIKAKQASKICENFILSVCPFICMDAGILTEIYIMLLVNHFQHFLSSSFFFFFFFVVTLGRVLFLLKKTNVT